VTDKITKAEIKEAAENSLFTFAQLVNPARLYGEIHEEVCNWFQSCDGKDQLLLLPRAHAKSHLIAVWCAWWITKHPDTTILYVSATEPLAIAQLGAIKATLESGVYRKFWPEMTHPDEGRRAQWAAKDIKVDHQLRKDMGVRDSTVSARGITANMTGLHADVIILDDIVVPDNAYTEVGRQGVQAGYSQLSSVLNPDGMTKAVGTRYHGSDIYKMMQDMEDEIYSDEGEIVGSEKVFDVMERVVEEEGIFLWPREKSPLTGKWYGFDHRTLSRIKSKYFAANERAQFYAQYYNNPSDPTSDRVGENMFQYLDPRNLHYDGASWYVFGKKLNVTMGGDLAYTTKPTSDYTAFAVVGKDTDGFLYILDLIQFRTEKYAEYFTKFRNLYSKWHFRKAKFETNAGANVIVKYIQEQCRREGIGCAILGGHTREDKDERAAARLEPFYQNFAVYHIRGGYTSVYEEQVILARPEHDDLRDAAVNAEEINTPPRKSVNNASKVTDITAHERFGGMPR